MLAVQVNYQGIQETIRHNKIAEEQNSRALDQNDIKIQQNWESIHETQRHNLATESETHRHNVETESLGYANLAYNYTALAETKRHNESTEALTFENLKEQRRHNLSVEGVQWAGVDLRYLEYGEQHRTNVARETETMRHDYAMESISADKNSIDRQRTIIQEQQGWASIANQERANEINQQNADTRWYEAQTSRKRQETDRTLGIWDTITRAINTTWSNLNDSLTVPSRYIKQTKEIRYEQN